ncbi:MAG: orotate phosphoribosyltransferase, partial [Gammaproteobacteria bacterium]
AALHGRILIVDDVISAGTSSRESVDIIRAAGATPIGVAISLDRQERGQGKRSAIQEIQAELGLRVISIATLERLIEFVQHDERLIAQGERLRAYREKYGSG